MISSKQLFVAATPGFLKPWWHRMESSPLGYRLARGAFWALTGALISRGLGLFSTFLVGRMLNAHGFGELGMIQSTVGVFGTVAGFGLGMSSTKYVAEFRRVAPSRAGRIIALASATAWVSGSFMAVALFLAASPIAHHILAAPQLDDMLRIGSVLLFLNGINAAQTGSLAGLEAFKTITRVNLVSGLVSFPATLAGVWWAGLHGALWAMVLTAALNCLLNYLALRDEARENAIPIAYRGCFQERHILLHFNLPGVLNSMMLSSSAWVCGAFLVNQLGGYNDMGVYNAAKRVQQLPEILMGMVMAPFLPVLSEAFGRKDMVTYCNSLKMAFSIAALLMIPFS